MMLKEAGYEVAEYRLLPDEQTQIETVLKELSDEKRDGSDPHDRRNRVFAKRLYTGSNDECSYPKCAGDCRSNAVCVTGYYPQSDVERGVSVIRNQTLIINLPGSPKAVKENLEYILPTLSHGLEIIKGVTGECGISLKET